MITNQLLRPASIVVVGASNNVFVISFHYFIGIN